MKKYKNWIVTGVLALIAVVFTIVVRFVDRTTYDITNTAIGCSKLNLKVEEFVGYGKVFYSISKYLGYFLFVIVALYIILGVYQLIKNKSFKKVNVRIYFLAIAYIIAGVIFLLFDKAIIINYRPILENKIPDVSYPSTHTLFATVICGTAIIINKSLYEHKSVFKSETLYSIVRNAIIVIGCVIIGCRALSGVHWITDIIAGLLFGTTIVFAYYSTVKMIDCKNE